MKVLAIVLTIGIVFSAQITPLRQQSEPLTNGDGAKNFLVGFLLSIEAANRIPDAFGCITSAGKMKTAVGTLVASFKSANFENIVHAVQGMTHALDDAANTCGSTTIEAKNYLGEMISIVKDAQFVKKAKAALYEHAEVAGRDIAELLVAKKEQDMLTAGIYAGDIAHIVLWGHPNPQ